MALWGANELAIRKESGGDTRETENERKRFVAKEAADRRGKSEAETGEATAVAISGLDAGKPIKSTNAFSIG